jgi:thymidylate kinase
MARGRFVVVLGIDGSGKSSLMAWLGARGLTVVDWTSVLEIPDLQLLYADVARGIAFKKTREMIAPNTRSFEFLLFFSAQWEYLIERPLAEGRDVVVDSYYYKQLAKDESFGFVNDALRRGLPALPDPDHVVFLDIPLDVAYRRKGGHVSFTEVIGAPDFAGFCRLQDQLSERMRGYTSHLPTTRLSSLDTPPAALAEELLRLLT